MSESVEAYLDGLRRAVDAALDRIVAPGDAPQDVLGPMRYSLLGPGKRLRPCLTLAVAERVALTLDMAPGHARTLAMPAACAVEMVHAYSLVHDDLPAMDDDALRRGRPTTHVVYGDGLAILAGDGLLTDAFGILAAVPSPAVPFDAPIAPVERRLRAVAVLAAAAGSRGMVGGQAINLSAAGRAASGAVALDPSALLDMHARKTGALIRAAATLGAVMVGAGDAIVAAVDEYAAELGLAFQIVDDVLDVEGSDAGLGKTAGKDLAAGKPTFPAIHGLEESKRRAAGCIARAHDALARAALGGTLDDIAEWSLRRTR